jgi:exonuclease III
MVCLSAAFPAADCTFYTGTPFTQNILQSLSGGIQHTALDILIEESYIDVFRHLNSDDNGYTIPAPSPNARLDYAFATISLIDHIISCYVMREPNEVDEASDHYPLILDVEL